MQIPKGLFIILFLCTFCWGVAKAQQKLLVAVQQYRDSVVMFDLNSYTKTGAVRIGFKPHEITYDPVSKQCFVSNFGLEDYDLKIGKTGNAISVIDPFAGKVVNTIYTSSDTSVHNGPHGIKVRPGKSHELFVNLEIGPNNAYGKADTMVVFDIKTSTIKRRFALPPGTHNFAFSADGKRLWLMSGPNGVYQVDPGNGNILQHAATSSPIRGLMVAKDWLVASGKNEVFLFSKKDLSVVKHFENLQTGQMLYSNVTNDQKYIIAPAAFDNVVLVIDAASGEVVHRLKTGGAPLNVQVTDTYAYITHARDNYIGVIDLKTFTMVKMIAAFGTNGMVLVE